MTPITWPPLVLDLARRCDAAGGRALLVGGCVRDLLTGRPIEDHDLEVYGIAADDLEVLLRGLGQVNAVGRAFAVYKLRRGDLEIDVSLPRRDNKVGPGHRGIAVRGDPAMTPAEAARRRDLTINAIMMDVLTQEIVDPWDGRRDLAARRLRAVDPDAFLEDPLRALRVVQFAARLGFLPDDALIALCARADLHELPAERVQEEWRKLLVIGARPSLGLDVARRAGVLARVFPEAIDAPEVSAAVDRAATLRTGAEGRDYAIALSAWLHRADRPAIEATLDRLGLHRWLGYPLRRRIQEIVPRLAAPTNTDARLRHLSRETELEALLLARHAVTGDAVALAHLDRARALGVAHKAPAPLFAGAHAAALGVQPGPRMGRLLEAVYRRQLDGDITTLDAAIREARIQLGR